MLNVVKGDLLAVKQGVIAHGCNCLGGFGSGIAGAIAKVYPQVKAAYMDKHWKCGWKLGEVQFVESVWPPKETVPCIDSGLVFANCATQFAYGKNGPHLDYSALERCMNKVLQYCEGRRMALSLPLIGCGLAGGKWDTVQEIIVRCNADRKIPITVYKL